MAVDSLRQVLLLLLEASVVALLLLAFFRLRKQFGLALLCVTLGTFQHLQTELASTLFIEVSPGLIVSPGSTILFMATLFATLLVYIRDDAAQAQAVIVGIVAANISLAIVMLLVNQHVGSAAVVVVSDVSTDFLTTHLKPLIIGTGMLCIDVVLIIVLYEFFFRIFRSSLFARIAMSMICVAILDTVVFIGVNFYDQPGVQQIILSGIIGKSAVGIYYSIAMVGYLRLFRPSVDTSSAGDDAQHEIFHILTYRQRYELLKDELARDSMTGLFNRRFFDENLRLEIERAARLGHRLSLMLLDLDNFKQINDRYGHQVGDQVILIAAGGMKKVLRAADVPCRYGGEEFAIIMPDSSESSARNAAARLSKYIVEQCAAEELPIPAETVTFTAGISFCPDDAMNAHQMLSIADRRLYAGKHGGRNQVVLGDAAIAPIVEAVA